jgi:hypothetical protein
MKAYFLARAHIFFRNCRKPIPLPKFIMLTTSFTYWAKIMESPPEFSKFEQFKKKIPEQQR